MTEKKLTYLNNAITDKHGTFNYLDNPTEYKKARKRLQNRDSAVRARQRKKENFEALGSTLDVQHQEMQELYEDNENLQKRLSEMSEKYKLLQLQTQF